MPIILHHIYVSHGLGLFVKELCKSWLFSIKDLEKLVMRKIGSCRFRYKAALKQNITILVPSTRCTVFTVLPSIQCTAA